MSAALVAKLLIPRQQSKALRRPQLVNLIASMSEGVVVVRAPAGFGKTTLLAELASTLPGEVGWLSLDEWDRDPQTLLGYLRMVAFGLTSNDEEATTLDTRVVLAEVSNRLAERSGPTWLILDDLHCLDEANDALDILNQLIARLPDGVVLVLSSRTPPGLRSLPRLRVLGRLLEMAPHDLAFSRHEVTSFWSNGSRSRPSDKELDNIMRVTEGWPAAVALAMRSGLPSVEGNAKDHLSQYLMTEMLSGLPERLQTFLLRTSVLEALEADACAVLTDVADCSRVPAILDQVEAEGVPLTRRVSHPPVAMIHPLVREFLRSQLQRDSELYRQLCETAGAWLSENGHIGNAVTLLAEARNWDRLAQVIESEATSTYRAGRWQTVLAWLEALPKTERIARPMIGLWEARILGRLGRVDEALRVIDVSLANCRTDSASVEAELEALRAASLRTKGEVGAAIEAATRSKNIAFERNVTVDVVSDARKELALALMAKGQFAAAVDELLPVLEIEVARGDTAGVAFAHGCLGSAYGALGRLAESVHHLEQAKHRWSELGNNNELCWVLNNLGMTYWHLGRDAEAELAFGECVQKSRGAGVVRAEGFALASLGDVDRAAGRFAAAADRYQEAVRIARELGEGILECFALVGLADTSRQLGDLRQAEHLAREGLASAELRGADFERGLCLLALGRVMRDAQQRQSAIEAFLDADRLFGGAGAVKEQAETLVLLADALLATRSNRSILTAVLKRMPRLLEEAGSTSAIRRYKRELAGACRHAISRRIDTGFYRDLLTSLSGGESNSPQDAPYPPVELRALGAFDVTVGGRQVDSVEWGAEKARELFLWLMLAERACTRDEIVGHLWPDHGGAKARSLFHSTLHRARRALYQEAIVESGGAYRLQPRGDFRSDVTSFLRLTQSGFASAQIADLTEAVSIYGGQLAPGMSNEWADEQRRRMEARYARANAELARSHLSGGDHDRAIECFERILRIDPSDEAACFGAMTAHASKGDFAAGIRLFDHYRRQVMAELGESPSHQLQALRSELEDKLHASQGVR